ncbi:hypothetical protein [Borrelia sp. RT1S]|uniref:hypothetical protein n=1 Tax=Borrelia sp. RT1S TaxID=2898580 RepID=UPI00279520AD|nr:hypothetical protein [Borrelia sp. RT1S]
MYRVLLLIGGSLLFVLYVLISGFCILEAIKSFFNKNKLNSNFMSEAVQVKKRSSEAGDVDEGTVYVKNLGTSRVRPQNGLGGPQKGRVFSSSCK